MVKKKANRVCYDLNLDLNKLHHLSESRKRVELTRGEPSGVRHQEGPLEGEEFDKEEEDPEEEEVMEEEEPYEEVEPVEEGELHIQDEPDVVMEPLEEQNLPDPPLAETEVQLESDIEMWEPKQEPPTYIEISSKYKIGNWGSHYDLYGYETGFDRGWSYEEDFEEEVEEVPANPPSDNDSESKEAYSISSSNLGEDGDDEDFDIASYDETVDTWDAWL